jgi:hypothetical protein
MTQPKWRARITHPRMRIPATPAQSHTANKKVEEASNLPQESGEVPSVRASNPLDWGKGQDRWNEHCSNRAARATAASWPTLDKSPKITVR